MSRLKRLGDADDMFRRFFDRWYSDDARTLKGLPATRPDLMKIPEYVGQPVGSVCPLTNEDALKSLARVERMRVAAENDWPTFLDVRAPVNLAWVKSFDTHYDLVRVEKLLAVSDPTDFSNDYVVTVCEFGAVLGAVMQDLLPRLVWLPSWPYWESSIFDAETGSVIPVFHWAIKKFSTYGIDDGFTAKLQVCVNMLQNK
jgi:hypothetical protein